MDISKASNFERFIFDLTGRNSAQVNELWSKVDKGNGFDLSSTPLFAKISDYGFISGSSSHAARIATIRDIYQRYRVLVDTHTADGLKVGQAHREVGVPLICLETAQPAKFAESIAEAIGKEPERPAGFEHLEDLPQRFVVKDADVQTVKAYIDEQCKVVL
jgi:threonine synthase